MQICWLLLPLILIALPASSATVERAQLSGTVRDESGAAIPGVSIHAIRESDGMRRSAKSGVDGEYIIAWLQPGRYKITARKPGFQTVARINFGLVTGANEALDLVMPVGSIREVITVESGPGTANAADAVVRTTLTREWLDNLPVNGRGIIGLVELAPGVLLTPAASGEPGQFTVNGQRANTNYFTVDGVGANTGVTGGGMPAQFGGGALPAMTAFGGTQNIATQQELEAMRIETSTFAPEFGRLPGAQVALTSRSGSNELHGSLFHSFRPDVLSASEWLGNAHGLDRTELSLRDWGATIGGPLLRDRTFFFASTERMSMRQPQSWRGAVPSLAARAQAPPQLRPVLNAFPLPNGRELLSNGPQNGAGCDNEAPPLTPPHRGPQPALCGLGGGAAEFVAVYSQPSRLQTASLRIDHTISPRVTLFGRYNQAPSSTESGFLQTDVSRFSYRSFTTGVASQLTPRFTSDVRVNVSAASARSTWRATGAGGSQPLDLSGLLGGAERENTVYALAIGGIGQLVSGSSGRNRQGQWNAVATLAWTGGRHAIRFGADYHRLTPRRETAGLSVAGNFNSLGALLQGEPMLVARAEAEVASSLIETLSLFVQDTFQVNERLSLTFGTRWELTPPPSFQQTFTAVGEVVPVIVPPLDFPRPEPGQGPAFTAPSPTGPLWPTRYRQFAPRIGATYRIGEAAVLRAGWGMFYDLAFSAATDPINGVPFNRWQVGLASPGIMSFDRLVGRVYTGDLELPYAQHWNVAFERSLTSSDVLSMSYVASAGRNLLRREGTLKPGTRIADIVAATNHGRSDYHGLQFQYRRRVARSLHGTAAYTWSHAIDDASWDSALSFVGDGIDASRDRSSSSFDARHVLHAAVSWQSPDKAGPLRALTRGWNVATLVRARSGFPIDVVTSQNSLGLGFDNITRPNFNPSVPLWVRDANLPGGMRLNPAAFVVPSGLQGNLGRNAIRGFGMWQVDAALERRFQVGERNAFELRCEAFNLLNRPSFADPLRYLDHPQFGHSASALNMMLGTGSPRSGLSPGFHAGAPRQLQVTLRFSF